MRDRKLGAGRVRGNAGEPGAEGGNRTRTGLADRRILSPHAEPPNQSMALSRVETSQGESTRGITDCRKSPEVICLLLASSRKGSDDSDGRGCISAKAIGLGVSARAAIGRGRGPRVCASPTRTRSRSKHGADRSGAELPLAFRLAPHARARSSSRASPG